MKEIEIACPHCNAENGEGCRQPRGESMGMVFHEARIVASETSYNPFQEPLLLVPRTRCCMVCNAVYQENTKHWCAKKEANQLARQ